MTRLLTRSQAVVFSAGSLGILAMTALMLAGMLNAWQWLAFSFVVFLSADVIAGRFASEGLNKLSALIFFICVAVFFIAAADRLSLILGTLL